MNYTDTPEWSVEEQAQDKLEEILSLCESYVEADQLEDVGNIRALYEEYAEWIDGSKCEVAWAHDLSQFIN